MPHLLGRMNGKHQLWATLHPTFHKSLFLFSNLKSTNSKILHLKSDQSKISNIINDNDDFRKHVQVEKQCAVKKDKNIGTFALHQLNCHAGNTKSKSEGTLCLSVTCSMSQLSRKSWVDILWWFIIVGCESFLPFDIVLLKVKVLMRPFGPLAALCLLALLQLVNIVHACKEIKLKFDLQRMVESEFNLLLPPTCLFDISIARDSEEDLRRHPSHHQGDGNQHHPWAGREGERFLWKAFFSGRTKLWMRLERDIPNIENHYTTATVWFLKSGNIQARRATVNRVRECWLTVLLGDSAVFVLGVVHIIRYHPKIRDDAIFLTHTVYCFWVWLPLVRFPICHEASGLWNLTRGWSLPPTPLWENPVFFLAISACVQW